MRTEQCELDWVVVTSICNFLTSFAGHLRGLNLWELREVHDTLEGTLDAWACPFADVEVTEEVQASDSYRRNGELFEFIADMLCGMLGEVEWEIEDVERAVPEEELLGPPSLPTWERSAVGFYHTFEAG